MKQNGDSKGMEAIKDKLEDMVESLKDSLREVLGKKISAAYKPTMTTSEEVPREENCFYDSNKSKHVLKKCDRV